MTQSCFIEVLEIRYFPVLKKSNVVNLPKKTITSHLENFYLDSFAVVKPNDYLLLKSYC